MESSCLKKEVAGLEMTSNFGEKRCPPMPHLVLPHKAKDFVNQEFPDLPSHRLEIWFH